MAAAEAAAVAARGADELLRKLEAEQRGFKTLQGKFELVEDELQQTQMEVVAVKEEMINYKNKAQAVSRGRG